MHLPRPDLDLKGDSLLVNNGSVQRLVHIGLGGGNIILEPVGDGLEQVVDDA